MRFSINDIDSLDRLAEWVTARGEKSCVIDLDDALPADAGEYNESGIRLGRDAFVRLSAFLAVCGELDQAIKRADDYPTNRN